MIHLPQNYKQNHKRKMLEIKYGEFSPKTKNVQILQGVTRPHGKIDGD